jgi:hypothetical protein
MITILSHLRTITFKQVAFLKRDNLIYNLTVNHVA